MPIREDVVASAAQFLQDPSVASSPVESRIAFLQSKNLTQEEVNAALVRASSDPGPAAPYSVSQLASAPPHAQPQPYYGQYPPYGWQPPPPEPPGRDWRDLFVMATVMGGLSYGLYALGKRYIYPLVAPPTPGRLEQDKKAIDEQFEKAFVLVEQLAKDVEAVKDSERERTERLDTALTELEMVINDIKTSNKRREDDTMRVRDDVQGLRDALPKAMEAQKETTDSRLREVNTELKSLKALISQRMNPNATSNNVSNYLRPPSGNAVSSGSNAAASSSADVENADSNTRVAEEAKEAKPRDLPDFSGRNSPFSSGMPAARASIPDWQRAAASPSVTNGAGSAAE